MASNNLFQLHRDSISFAQAYFTITERLGQSSLAPQQFKQLSESRKQVVQLGQQIKNLIDQAPPELHQALSDLEAASRLQ